MDNDILDVVRYGNDDEVNELALYYSNDEKEREKIHDSWQSKINELWYQSNINDEVTTCDR